VNIADLLAALEWNGIIVALCDDGDGIDVNVASISADKRFLLEIIRSHSEEIAEHLRANRERTAADAGAIAEGILRGGARPATVATLCWVCRVNLFLRCYLEQAIRLAHRVGRKWT
jgi:hypothetical protein